MPSDLFVWDGFTLLSRFNSCLELSQPSLTSLTLSLTRWNPYRQGVSTEKVRDEGENGKNKFFLYCPLFLAACGKGVELLVELRVAERFGVAHDDELHPCAGNCHVHAPQVAQETNLALAVGAYE